ncbi:MAG: PQQ-like beta-propeller repeat protein [Methanophagales archaeon]|nr:PQQ-like beta-propeller repeat protein [Methanophagales archaeon]
MAMMIMQKVLTCFVMLILLMIPVSVLAVNDGDKLATTRGIEEIELLWEFPVDTHIRDIAFGDLNGDRITDVVASVVDGGSIDWSVVGLEGNSGEVLWKFGQTLAVSNVEVGDINGDGSLEVILLDWDKTIYVLNGVNGQLLWSKTLTLNALTIKNNEVFGYQGKSLKVEDIDHDGMADIVVGNGDIILLDGNGNVVWTFHCDIDVDYVDIGDLSNDGYEDIVITDKTGSDVKSAIVYAISGKDGSPLWAYDIPPFDGSSTHSRRPQGISIATLSDNTKYVAVIFGLCSTDSTNYHISAIDGATGKELWKYEDDMRASYFDDVTTGDLNGDGADDILQIGDEVVALDNMGNVLWKWSVYVTQAAIVFDMNKDGNPEVCMNYAIYGGIDGELITYLPRKADETTIGAVEVVGVKDITGDSYPEIITGHNPSTGVRAFTLSHPAIPKSEEVIAAQITAGADDGFAARTPEYFSADSKALTIGTDLKFAAFLRFSDLKIPANATITKAYISVVPAVTNQAGPMINLSAADVADPTAPTTSSDFYARKRTTSSVNWDASSWAAGESENSTDISSVIQELVDSYDYSAGAHILIFLNIAEEGTENQYFAAFEDAEYDAPKLFIEYSTGG